MSLHSHQHVPDRAQRSPGATLRLPAATRQGVLRPNSTKTPHRVTRTPQVKGSDPQARTLPAQAPVSRCGSPGHPHSCPKWPKVRRSLSLPPAAHRTQEKGLLAFCLTMTKARTQEQPAEEPGWGDRAGARGASPSRPRRPPEGVVTQARLVNLWPLVMNPTSSPAPSRGSAGRFPEVPPLAPTQVWLPGESQAVKDAASILIAPDQFQEPRTGVSPSSHLGSPNGLGAMCQELGMRPSISFL